MVYVLFLNNHANILLQTATEHPPAMAETQPQPNYQYTPSSAQSTRQLLDSTSPSTSSNPNEIPFRPQIFTRKSSNYAEADARARAAVAEIHASMVEGGSTQGLRKEKENADTASSGNPSASWRPKPGRKQSWNQQDFKREMHMSTVTEAGKGAGFTETGKQS
jgi:hypothetical protein